MDTLAHQNFTFLFPFPFLHNLWFIHFYSLITIHIHCTGIQDALEEKSVLYGAVRDIQKYLKRDMAEGSVVHKLIQDEYDEDVEVRVLKALGRYNIRANCYYF